MSSPSILHRVVFCSILMRFIHSFIITNLLCDLPPPSRIGQVTNKLFYFFFDPFICPISHQSSLGVSKLASLNKPMPGQRSVPVWGEGIVPPCY